jgi:hypothetical protein
LQAAGIALLSGVIAIPPKPIIIIIVTQQGVG